jgi:hypothetical protein
MNRLFLIAALSTIASGGAFAGAIAVNLTTAGNNGISILNKNLAGNGYIPCISGTTTNGNTCTTANTTVANPPSGTAFNAVLFNGVQVPFDIASGGANSGTGAGNTNNIWAPGNAAGNQSVTIDVGNYTTNAGGTTTSGNESGVFEVNQIWTMLDDIQGSIGYQGITLTLKGYKADGVTPITETIDLTAGVDYRSLGQTSVPNNRLACDVANASSTSGTLGTNCTGHAPGTTVDAATDSNYNATNVSEGVTITVYNSLFVTQDTLATPDSYWLDAQGINLGGAFLNGWLNTVTVTSNDGTGTQEKAILSALTISQAPEPGTVVLFGTGLAALVFFQLKRVKLKSTKKA